MHAYDNWKNPITGDTHWTKKKPMEKQRRIEYKSDNIVVRHSFFENKMCDVRDNPRWALTHVDVGYLVGYLGESCRRVC